MPKKKNGEAAKKKKGGILGSGLAEDARMKLKGRRARLDEIERAMMGAGTITKKK